MNIISFVIINNKYFRFFSSINSTIILNQNFERMDKIIGDKIKI